MTFNDLCLNIKEAFISVSSHSKILGVLPYSTISFETYINIEHQLALFHLKYCCDLPLPLLF